ncbi:DUF5057 domain-containing protein [Caloramator sp. mosi_1]|uniref:DUF5057 domain-containing protein n=1 Tax=Caloramator sp. mosi_1 TaxID=3023090 RepID=UPI002360FAF2|nr:DUF5057 domain-containing protein [Caloramator sp. mosi_1]WDC85735.1 DUF5057 domain-containing protein [Caloramator sp. mosi_1]
MYWKLEIKSNSDSRIKYVKYGLIKYKGIKITGNIFQIRPNNDFKIYDAFKNKANDLKIKFDDSLNLIEDENGNFSFKFDSMKCDDLNNLNKSINFSSKYDMIIFGFGDTYRGDIGIKKKEIII